MTSFVICYSSWVEYAKATKEPHRAVALLIDFENLLPGLLPDAVIDPRPLFELSQDYGRVVLAQAYADWRSPSCLRHQEALYRDGVDIVSVIGRKQGVTVKNAVDVKLAVDAVELLWTLPHIQTFVIVSGDRDFIHLLKCLRRHGKVIVGVSPERSASSDFADLCDRFVRYESLSTTFDPGPQVEPKAGPSREAVEMVLRQMIAQNPNGISGSLIKPELRKHLGTTFDWSDLGYRRLTDMLLSFPDVLKVCPAVGSGDFTAMPAVTQPSVKKVQRSVTPVQIQEVGLRRNVLSTLYKTCAGGPFTLEAVGNTLKGGFPSVPQPAKAALLRDLAAVPVWDEMPDQATIAKNNRKLTLRKEITSAKRLVRVYELSIVRKLLSAKPVQPVNERTVRQTLGLNKEQATYAASLLEEANRETTK